ncbi:hypothetical protein VM1G_09617 [Cytospora mali]|uniref:Uncharacterized protein n=1 Tax=Cytospora mali TaxID=578113 RepID=A0A194WBU4_CYTMA|nr:hypothetical protein VM1G_09617 [Valsa mali]
MSPTMAPSQEIKSPTITPSQISGATPSEKWHTLAATFITLFTILLLLASTLALCHLHRKNATLRALKNTHGRITTIANSKPNPHSFGSDPWRAHELAKVPSSSRDALRIADLEAQNNLLGQRVDVLEGLVDMLKRQNLHAGRENAGLRLGAAAILGPGVGVVGGPQAGAEADGDREDTRRL